MEQDVDEYITICSLCLSSGRTLISLNCSSSLYSIFRLLMSEFVGEEVIASFLQMNIFICWECMAMLKRVGRFRKQVQNAQQHLKIFSMNNSQESLDHTYMSQSLSSLECVVKRNYDRVFVDTNEQVEWTSHYIAITPQDVKNESFDVSTIQEAVSYMDDQIIGVPELVLKNPLTGVMSHIVVGTDPIVSSSQNIKAESNDYIIRQELKQQVQYASAVYKCELCIIGFYMQQQVEEHFESAHKERPNTEACKICYVYIDVGSLESHTRSHYTRYTCKICPKSEMSLQLIKHHVKSHLVKPLPNNVFNIEEAVMKKKRKKDSNEDGGTSKSGNLRKLLSKTTITGYKCLECDMFFKNSRARKNHVARFHREGLQCDHCKKRFVNRTTLATHLKLHEGPPPRKECPICGKMVRVIQLKYHIQRHQTSTKYECEDCSKVFSHLATYQAHLKYSRAHATEMVLKFPCPMCNKGYPTKEAMQDHFNYQHLGKTTHKCPICEKPIASKANIEKHIMRVHKEKKEKPKNHVCRLCGKAFSDKKALNQHEVIHSCERPLSCDICSQTFKQKASLYTHKKRVHKHVTPKRVVEFMEK
ncbi:zinc finger protein 62 homolog [Leptidea sinapis]|uniref:zinc finger protein 62 homolog n=1 Tax=Leptidea sinapis TaxID=189913 RepID=UPI0021C2E9C5|nr:zinc finger protein 62 homolog [Leptidea sinapis]